MIPFVTLVLGGVIYQLSLKKVPLGSGPFETLSLAYGLVLCMCLLGRFLTTDSAPPISAKAGLNYAFVGIAIGVMLIECSYLFSYRMGHSVSTLMLTAASCVALILVIVGVTWFSERLSVSQWIGVGLSDISTVRYKALSRSLDLCFLFPPIGGWE